MSSRGSQESSCSRCKKCCQSCLTMTFSTLGLIIVIVSYTVVGGLLFKHLEEGREQDDIEKGRQAADRCRQEYAMKLWNITELLDEMTLNDSDWGLEVADLLKEFEVEIYNITKNQWWDGRFGDDELLIGWSFSGALLYAVSAITTIGYGHVTPRTSEGQLLTILYCVIGLPLTLMCIAKLGRAFAFVFRVIYHTCCCAICCLYCIAKKMKNKKSMSGINGDSGENDTEVLSALVVGKDSNNNPGTIMVGGKTYRKYTLTEVWCRRVKSRYEVGLRHESVVPTYLCVLVMTGYIAGGALLFSQWEPDWSFQDAAYFCFITLTTIGFGDFVPGVAKMGTNKEYDANSENLVLCALYVFIGLAFIGMCIDLMQVDVINKIKWLGRVIGLSESKHRRTNTDRKIQRVGLKLSNDNVPPTKTNSSVSFAQQNVPESRVIHESKSYSSLGSHPTISLPMPSKSAPNTPHLMNTSSPARLFSFPPTTGATSSCNNPTKATERSESAHALFLTDRDKSKRETHI